VASTRTPKRAKARADFSAADAELAETLDNLDGAGNYAGWIYELIEPHLGAEVLEIGAGHGTFTEMLAGKATRIVASDISERCVSKLRTRFPGAGPVEVFLGSVDSAAAHGPFDTVVMINVLEHIEDDDGALRELRDRVLRPGGQVVLWVPAFSLLYSDFDRKIGHHRRYTKPGLRAQLTRAGFEVTDIRYVNPVGAMAWLVLARLLRRTPTNGTPVKVFDRYFVPVLKRLEQRWQPPFGQSVLAVAARPAVVPARAEAQ
jgi:ubiquinone/menaquinone biosynthesis C-methylase UbiE